METLHTPHVAGFEGPANRDQELRRRAAGSVLACSCPQSWEWDAGPRTSVVGQRKRSNGIPKKSTEVTGSI